MKMATDNLKGEQQRRLEARKNYIEQHLKPLDGLHSMNDGEYQTILFEINIYLMFIFF
jgi:hypothetical protein